MKLKLIYICFLLCWLGSVQVARSQGHVFNSLLISHKEKADQWFQQKSYFQALQLYKKVKPKDLNDSINLKIARCYYQLDQLDSAETYFDKIVDTELVNPEIRKQYAEILLSNGKKEEALQQFLYHYGQHPSSLVAAKIKAIETYETFYELSDNYLVKPIKANSHYSEISLTYFQQDLFMLSNRYQDQLVKRIDTRNESPLPHWYIYNHKTIDFQAWNDLNTEDFKGDIAFFDQDQKVIFSAAEKTGTNQFGHYKLYYGERQAKKWSKPVKISLVANGYSAIQPTLSTDGQVLIFASDQPGGAGGMDLYKSEFINGSWTSPQNLGSRINTPGDEITPFLDEHGVLYFASNGLPGMGGLDIYRIKLRQQLQAENMGAPINSARNDFGLIYQNDQHTGFFTSNRKYSDDVFFFENLQEKITGDSVVVTDLKSRKKIPFKLEKDLLTFPAVKGTEYVVQVSKNGVKSQYQVTNEHHQKDSLSLNLTGISRKEEIIIQGNVYDMKSGERLSRVKVNVTSFSGPDQELISDQQGNFHFRIDQGEVFLLMAHHDQKSGFLEGLADEEIGQLKLGLSGKDVAKNHFKAFVLDQKTGQPLKDLDASLLNISTGQIIRINSFPLINIAANPDHQFELILKKPGYHEQKIALNNEDLIGNSIQKIKMKQFVHHLNLEGYIYDSLTGMPLPQAEISVTSLASPDQKVQSNEQGHFHFTGVAGDV
ncbi:MAG: tetratricopeptide repeat protein, partial [Candidatus Cyclobacteriaceae bacterium M3_2C_046]